MRHCVASIMNLSWFDLVLPSFYYLLVLAYNCCVFFIKNWKFQWSPWFFAKQDILNLVSSWIVTEQFYAYVYQELTWRNLEVTEFSFLRKSKEDVLDKRIKDFLNMTIVVHKNSGGPGGYSNYLFWRGVRSEVWNPYPFHCLWIFPSKMADLTIFSEIFANRDPFLRGFCF